MTRKLALLLFLLLPTRALADYVSTYADLVCDPAKNLAEARFTWTWDSDPPKYTKLPPTADDGMSAQDGTGHRVCTLGNGWEIKIRNGEEDSYAYGAGGAAPPDFFSLWIDKKKVLSKKVWSSWNYDEDPKPVLAAVVISQKRLTYCELKHGDDKPPTCRDESLSLDKLPVDTIEYPEKQIFLPLPPKPGQLIVSGDNPWPCHDAILHGDNDQGVIPGENISGAESEPDLPIADADTDSIDIRRYSPSEDVWPTISDWKSVFGPPWDADTTLPVSFPPYARDFDGDSLPDTVIQLSDEVHYFDGSFFVVAPKDISVIEMLKTLYPDPQNVDQNKAAEIALAHGWGIYAGGIAGLYPGHELRYTKVIRLHIDGKDYLLASPTYIDDTSPIAILISPKPKGAFETVCTFDRVHLHY